MLRETIRLPSVVASAETRELAVKGTRPVANSH